MSTRAKKTAANRKITEKSCRDYKIHLMTERYHEDTPICVMYDGELLDKIEKLKRERCWHMNAEESDVELQLQQLQARKSLSGFYLLDYDLYLHVESLESLERLRSDYADVWESVVVEH